MSDDRHLRGVLPIPYRPPAGLTTYDAKASDTACPPIEPLLPNKGSPNVLVVLLDYAENICTATVVARYPSQTPVLAELAPLLTAAKWLTLTTCFGLLVVGIVAALVAAIRRRRRG